MEREIWEKREKDKGDREMSRLKKGDIIECFNSDELKITEVREAADEKED